MDEVEGVGGRGRVERVGGEADVGYCVAVHSGSIFGFGCLGGGGVAVEGVGNYVDVLSHVADFDWHGRGEDSIPVAFWGLILVEARYDSRPKVGLRIKEDGFVGEEDVDCGAVDRDGGVEGGDPEVLAFVDGVETFTYTEALEQVSMARTIL